MNLHMLRIARCLSFGACLLIAPIRSTHGEELRAEDRQKIEQLARMMDAFDRRGPELLARFGFPPAGKFTERWNDWRKLPLARQLELAWRSAEQAEHGSGEGFLRAYAGEVASINQAVHDDPVLRDLVPVRGQSATTPTRYRFSVPQGELATTALPQGARRIVGALAQHASMAPGGVVSMVARCCGISEAKALEMLFEVGSNREYLEQAIANGEVPRELAKRLARLTADVTTRNQAVLTAAELARLRPVLEELATRPGAPRATDTFAMPADGSEFDPIERAVNAELNVLAEERRSRLAGTSAYDRLHDWMRHPSLAAELDWGARRDRLFQISSYGEPGTGGGEVPSLHARPPGTFAAGGFTASRGFSAMRMFSGGLGGVIFGGQVEAEPKLSKPLVVSWQPLTETQPAMPLAPQTSGVFVFRLDDGEAVVSPPVRADDANAAVRIVFTGVAGTPALRAGEGIGLAGTGREVTRYRIEGGEVQVVADEYARSFYVHPAISRTSMGLVAMLADVRPAPGPLSAQFEAQINKSSAPDETKQRVAAWLRMLNGRGWKFTDVPLQVYRSSGVVSTRKVAVEGVETEASCDCFLSMQTFDASGKPYREQNDFVSFQSVFPVLLEHLPEYRRLNEFARQLALLRWAAASGAAWRGDIEIAPAARSAATLFVNGGHGIEFGLDPDEQAFAFAQQVERESRAILDASNAAAELRALDTAVAAHRRSALALAAIQRVTEGQGMFYLSAEETVELAQAQKVLSVPWEVLNVPMTMEDTELDGYLSSISDVASLEHVRRARALYKPIAGKVEADAAVLASRWEALAKTDPLRGGWEGVMGRLAEAGPELRVAIEQGVARRRQLEQRLTRLMRAAWQPRSASENVEVRLAFASDAEQAALQPRLDAWRRALDDDSADHEALANELLLSLRPVDDVALGKKLYELGKQIEDGPQFDGIAGLSQWWKLQQSYRIVTTDGATDDHGSPRHRAMSAATDEPQP